ncbi:hypothetical protein [Dethiosulfatarculus sandiegensis]|uniref:Group II intron maturase-specific domain-containing protein n=1 Tax=Dethiosulfatarculus sandiegensis TaxID=1429043 RepID=A0A0D2JA00_9BACT|nr:hypothetical protein [Dethiosulfatarculus sandiegensis]KIX12491.1 hypothetical protein X474_18885 [Dethiosulfatarculus sandiegensis]
MIQPIFDGHTIKRVNCLTEVFDAIAEKLKEIVTPQIFGGVQDQGAWAGQTGTMYRKLDHIVFWKLAQWLAGKYRCSIKKLMRRLFKRPAGGQTKTWILFGRSASGNLCGVALRLLVGSPKHQFKWRNPEVNPYMLNDQKRSTVTSRYQDVAMAMGRA